MTASTDRISIQLPELRVLIVEDDPVMRLGLGRLLGAYPQLKMVGEAEDGYSGVEAALALKPNLIVMDIGLPELDGIAATQQIKSSLPAVRVMMLTSHSSEQEIIASLSSGADGFCVKGLGLEKLVVAIASVQDGAVYLDPQVAQCVVNHLRPAAPAKAKNPLTDREQVVQKQIVEGHTTPENA